MYNGQLSFFNNYFPMTIDLMTKENERGKVKVMSYE